MAPKIIKDPLLTDQSRPSSALFEILMAINRSGTITGKLNTTIKVVPFWVFEAIAEINVKVEENPIEDNSRLIMNKLLS